MGTGNCSSLGCLTGITSRQGRTEAAPTGYELITPPTANNRKPPAPPAPGFYLYCGSAKGPGGLAARLARHMRHGKAIRWHVDVLTEAGTVLGAWTFPGGDECDRRRPFTLASADRRFRKYRLPEVQEPLAARRSLPRPRGPFGAAWSETRCCLIFGSEAAALLSFTISLTWMASKLPHDSRPTFPSELISAIMVAKPLRRGHNG